MVIVGIARLATHVGESLDRGRWGVVCASVVEQERPHVFRHEHVLQLGLSILDESLQEEPSAREVELQGDVVGRVRQVSEVDPRSARIEERPHTLDRFSAGS